MTQHADIMARGSVRAIEWPTLVLVSGTYALWAATTALLFPVAPILSIILIGILCAFHSSLTHEAVHGHPFANKALNEALMFAPLSVWIPYRRFRDLHLAHHMDSRLTDPFDDPESNYLDPGMWEHMPRWLCAIYRVNNTLLGRMVVGSIMGLIVFIAGDIRSAWRGDRQVQIAWAMHLPGVTAVLAWVWFATDIPVWAYLISAQIGLALLKIRTFLEHQAHERARGRTVIIEDRGPLSFLFLNNNLHVVHHMHPRVPWYQLPTLYRENRQRYLDRYEGYLFRSYGEVFRRYLFKAKDPVPHPLWRRS